MPLAYVVGQSTQVRARLAEFHTLPTYQDILLGHGHWPTISP